MENLVWTLMLTAVGVAGFYIVGKKLWWAWYVNVFAQLLWIAFAVSTKQYGFLLSVAFYGTVFIKNAIQWTREHKRVDAMIQHNPEFDTADDQSWSVYRDYCEKDVEATLSLYNDQEKSRMKDRIHILSKENAELKDRLNRELHRRDLLR